MGRHTEARCKLCRREGEKLFLRGEKCLTAKCPMEKRSYAPGLHGKLPARLSEYGIRLREKQKARRIYGLSERQFLKYFKEASKKKGITGDKLLEFLERRLDNVVFRLGFAPSRAAARELVSHGHIKVNGRKVNIPSYEVKAEDTITTNKEKSFKIIKENLEKAGERSLLQWLSLDASKLEGRILRLPTKEDISTTLQMHLIIEHYSR